MQQKSKTLFPIEMTLQAICPSAGEMITGLIKGVTFGAGGGSMGGKPRGGTGGCAIKFEAPKRLRDASTKPTRIKD